MERSLKNLEKTERLVIRVSAEDMELVRKKQEELMTYVNENCEVEIIMDSSLEKNQCRLEADKQIIDCSLDVQLQGLIEDLKLMM